MAALHLQQRRQRHRRGNERLGRNTAMPARVRTPGCARTTATPGHGTSTSGASATRTGAHHEIGYKPIEQWAPLVLEAAKAMKAADPRIQLTAAALPSREWTLPLLKMAGQYLDLHLNPQLLAAALAEERHARLPDLHHAFWSPGDSPLPITSACWKNPDTAAGSRSLSTNGISAVGIIRASRAKRSRTTCNPKVMKVGSGQGEERHCLAIHHG